MILEQGWHWTRQVCWKECKKPEFDQRIRALATTKIYSEVLRAYLSLTHLAKRALLSVNCIILFPYPISKYRTGKVEVFLMNEQLSIHINVITLFFKPSSDPDNGIIMTLVRIKNCLSTINAIGQLIKNSDNKRQEMPCHIKLKL